MFSNAETVTQKETPDETTNQPSPVFPPINIPWPDRVADPDPEFDPANPENQKRNCGHTGPISEAGKAKIAQNARKHGACSRTLILPGESEKEWRKLFAQWQHNYSAYDPESVIYQFVLKTAQAEWHRLRVQLAYDDFLVSNPEFMVCLMPEPVRKHELLSRYKTTAERAFQREFRLLEQCYKSEKQKQKEQQKKAEADQAAKPFVTPPMYTYNEETGECEVSPGVECLVPLFVPKNERRRNR